MQKRMNESPVLKFTATTAIILFTGETEKKSQEKGGKEQAVIFSVPVRQPP